MGGRATLQGARTTQFEAHDPLNAQLKLFIKIARSIIAIYGEPGDKMMFKPARHIACRLAKYGISNHVPCISAELCIDKEQAVHMHEALITLTTPLNKRNRNRLTRSELRVIDRS